MSTGSEFETLYNKAKEYHASKKDSEYENLLSQLLQKGALYLKTAF